MHKYSAVHKTLTCVVIFVWHMQPLISRDHANLYNLGQKHVVNLMTAISQLRNLVTRLSLQYDNRLGHLLISNTQASLTVDDIDELLDASFEKIADGLSKYNRDGSG